MLSNYVFRFSVKADVFSENTVKIDDTTRKKTDGNIQQSFIIKTNL